MDAHGSRRKKTYVRWYSSNIEEGATWKSNPGEPNQPPAPPPLVNPASAFQPPAPLRSLGLLVDFVVPCALFTSEVDKSASRWFNPTYKSTVNLEGHVFFFPSIHPHDCRCSDDPGDLKQATASPSSATHPRKHLELSTYKVAWLSADSPHLIIAP